MKSDTQAIVEFCRILSRARKLFRESHISAENSGRFVNVSCTTSHDEKYLIERNEQIHSIEVSISLDSQLSEITDDGKYSLGVSVAIYNIRGIWKCCGDVGWSCSEIGWEEFTSKDVEFASVEQLKNGFLRFVECLLESYDKMQTEHFSNKNDRGEKQ